MPNAVVLDTNVLPVWRGLDGPLWLSIRKLCEVSGIPIYLPDLVMQESVNLRIEKFGQAAAEFVDAYNKVQKFFDIDPIYVPDVGEIGETWEAELRGAFTLVEVDGADCAEALRREARRMRPARLGRGGRDSAIWMTALRLARSHDTIYFVSKNTADFAAGKEGLLHPTLVAEAAEFAADISFLTSTHGLIEALAQEVKGPDLAPNLVGQTLGAELRELVLAAALTDERYADVGTGTLSLDGVDITRISVPKSFSTAGRNLALVTGSGNWLIGQPDNQLSIGFTFVAWLDFEADDGTILAGEVESTALT